MRQLRVYFDLDGTLIDTSGAVERSVSDWMSIDYKITRYNPLEMTWYPAEANDWAARLFADPIFLTELTATSEAKSVFRSLELFCEVGIVTSRPQSLKHRTVQQCYEQFGWSGVNVTGDKSFVARARNVDFLIEDCLEVANHTAEHAPECVVMLCDKSYNQGQTHPSIMRVDTLSDAQYLILRKVANL